MSKLQRSVVGPRAGAAPNGTNAPCEFNVHPSFALPARAALRTGGGMGQLRAGPDPVA